MTGVVDYGAGNLKSVETALAHLGAAYIVAAEPEPLKDCDRLIFPGVGEAASAMKVLRARGWDAFLSRFAASGRPLLGICLGCQIILEHSEEGNTPCLGLIPGEAVLFEGRGGLKVPHMGWNTVEFPPEHPLFRGVPRGSSFYFVHSYYPRPSLDDRGSRREGRSPLPVISLGRCEYGETFDAAFARGNVMATQFHPEKSGPPGLRILENFLSLGASDFPKEGR